MTQIEAGAAGDVSMGQHVLKAFLDFGVKLDSINSHLQKIRDEEAAYQYGTVDHVVQASGTAPASGSLWLDLGGPPQFRMWQLRRLIIGGLTFGTTAAGSANVYVSPSVPNPGFLGAQVDQAATLPLPAFYSTHQVVLHAGERLFVEIASPTAEQMYVAAGSVEDSEDRRRKARTEL